MGVILSTRGLTKHFGGVHALHEIDIDIEANSTHGLIGPNGSGKTTFFNVVSGVLPPTHGEIYFNDKKISNLPPHLITKQGISRTFQEAHILPMMTCTENVMTGAYCHTKADLRGTYLRAPLSPSKQETAMRERAMGLLKLVGLIDSAERWAGDLVWVETQLLQIARALAAQPELLLLDEPTAGMGEKETKKVENIIQKIRDMGITVILVSHGVESVMRLSDYVTAIDFGEKISEGTPVQVRNDAKVIEAYLGKEH